MPSQVAAKMAAAAGVWCFASARAHWPDCTGGSAGIGYAVFDVIDRAWAGPLMFAALGVAALVWRRPRVEGTTLVAAWWWAVTSFACVGLAEIIAVTVLGQRSTSSYALRYAAACTAFCPLMALLGAKRPQHRMWQFIVLSLWLVLALPAAQWWLFASGAIEIHPVRTALMALLVVVSLINYLPTRSWIAGLCYAGALVAVVSPFLALGSWPPPMTQMSIAALALADVGLVFALPPDRKRRQPLDRLWIDFRDTFGTVWAMRVLERVNAVARGNGLSNVLSWRGFLDRGADGGTDAESKAAIETFYSLLGRFVSPAWIESRAGQGKR